MATDINLSQLVINKLTKAQYDEAEAANSINDNELYFITDDEDSNAIVIDEALSETSENPVQNKVVTSAISSKQDVITGTNGQVVGFDTEGNAVATNDYKNAILLDGETLKDISGKNITEDVKAIIAPTEMTGATSSAAGSSGLVPTPAAGDEDKFLKGDGTWAKAAVDIQSSTTDLTAGTSPLATGSLYLVYE